MRKNYYFMIALSAVMILGSFSRTSATVPPPPVNQKIGIPDAVFNNLLEGHCRYCHAGSTPNSTIIEGRHHLKVGMIIPAGTAAPYGTPGTVYSCVSCHTLVWDPIISGYVLAAFRDCLKCHTQKAGEASVHHLTLKAKTRDCKACHGPIDNPNDGHYIPSYPKSTVTPNPGMGNGTGGEGGCAFCHRAGISPTGYQVFSNMETHHGTGVVSGPFTHPITSLAGCNLCHIISTANSPPPIRGCQVCHGVNSLHNIQVDSDKNGIITPDKELAYYGHIGNQKDCMGCHGNMTAASAAPYSGPIVPDLAGLSDYVLTSGSSHTLTLSGSAFTNSIQTLTGTMQLTSKVVFTHQSGQAWTIEPSLVTENTIQMLLPANMAAGNYLVKVTKGMQSSNSMNLSLIPFVKIDTAECVNGTIKVTGTGFSLFLNAVGSRTSVGLSSCAQNELCNVVSWDDTKIQAKCSSGCGEKINVNSIFGLASATIPTEPGDLATCTTCHGNNTALVNCRNKTWRQHARKQWVSCGTYDLAEKTYLGSSCGRTAGTTGYVKDPDRKH